MGRRRYQRSSKSARHEQIEGAYKYPHAKNSIIPIEEVEDPAFNVFLVVALSLAILYRAVIQARML